MKPSTATFIPYNLRPAKQVERRILIDFLRCANTTLIPTADIRYVGMGGTMFYDFHLVHRFLGVNKMVSLERDGILFPRSQFNAPFDFVKVKPETVATFLATDSDESVTVYWLDYDDGLSPEIAADILTLSTRLKVGGSAFVTVAAGVPGHLFKLSSDQRLEYIINEFPAFASLFRREDMGNGQFADVVYRILVAAFANAFSARRDGVFLPDFRIQYKDSTAMITVGGHFCTSADRKVFRTRVRADLPFLLRRDRFYIRHQNLTDRERSLFDIAVTKPRRSSKQAGALRKIGFEKKDFDSYKDLIRFLPRYQEGII